MKDETRQWLAYANENLESAKVLLDKSLYNPCLQNVQQAVEKMLKAALIEFSIKLKRTHSISELMLMLTEKGIDIDLTEDECDLLDSIYLPSKYPIGSALPSFEPDSEICQRCIAVAERVKNSIKPHLE